MYSFCYEQVCQSIMSTDESHHCHRQFRSPSSAWHTNFARSYDQPFDVGRHQSAYECPPAAACASLDFVPAVSMQIPNLVPNTAVFNDRPHLSCPSMMPDKHWYYKPDITSTSFYAHGGHTVSKPATVVQSNAPSSSLVASSSVSVYDDKCHGSGDVNKNCDKTNAVTEDCGRMPAEVFSNISSASSCNTAMEASSEATLVTCSNKTDIAMSVSGSESTATAVVPSAAPRPKCGRAKTNAELKRQLMERREQRLRDMQDSSSESIIPSSVSNNLVYKQTESSPLVVSNYDVNLCMFIYDISIFFRISI